MELFGARQSSGNYAILRYILFPSPRVCSALSPHLSYSYTSCSVPFPAYSTIGTGPGVISNESLHSSRLNMSPTHQSGYNNRRQMYNSTRNGSPGGSGVNGYSQPTYRSNNIMQQQQQQQQQMKNRRASGSVVSAGGDEVQLRPVRKFPVLQRSSLGPPTNHIRTSDSSDVIAQKLANVKIKQVKRLSLPLSTLDPLLVYYSTHPLLRLLYSSDKRRKDAEEGAIQR